MVSKRYRWGARGSRRRPLAIGARWRAQRRVGAERIRGGRARRGRVHRAGASNRRRSACKEGRQLLREQLAPPVRMMPRLQLFLLMLVAVAAILPGAQSDDVGLVTSYWWRYPSSDCGYDDVSPAQSCKGNSVAQCKALCLATHGCGGFNFPHGVLKKADCLAHKKPAGAVELYVLENIPQPPPPQAPWGVVWPVPRVWDWQHSGAAPLAVTTPFRITVNCTGMVGDQPGRLTRAVERYTDIIQSEVRAAARPSHPVAPVTSLTLQVESWDEALTTRTNSSYTLTVTSAGAVVTAPTIYGAMYGMESFSQLPSPGSSVINATRIAIADWPTYHHRCDARVAHTHTHTHSRHELLLKQLLKGSVHNARGQGFHG